MVPPKPRRKPTTTVEAAVLKGLTEHRGRLLTDCRWLCVCGWRSERQADELRATFNHAAHGEREGRTHQAEEIVKALVAAQTEEEKTDEV